MLVIEDELCTRGICAGRRNLNKKAWKIAFLYVFFVSCNPMLKGFRWMRQAPQKPFQRSSQVQASCVLCVSVLRKLGDLPPSASRLDKLWKMSTCTRREV